MLLNIAHENEWKINFLKFLYRERILEIIILHIIDIIGTMAFALAGYIISSRADYDILGITFISFISAFAGGVTRDVMLGHIPGIFLASYSMIAVVIVIIIAMSLKYHSTHSSESLEQNKLFVIADTIGLSTFAYTGATLGIQSALNPGGIIFLALFSAVGGGLFRDVIMNKHAYVLKEDFYGAVAVIVGLLVILMNAFGFLNPLTGIGIIGIGIAVRLIAIKYQWHLPKMK